jgi:PhoH-like ATPase
MPLPKPPALLGDRVTPDSARDRETRPSKQAKPSAVPEEASKTSNARSDRRDQRAIVREPAGAGEPAASAAPQPGVSTTAERSATGSRRKQAAPAADAASRPTATTAATAAPKATAARSPGRAGRSSRVSRRAASGPKLFVLDTNVLMHDPSSLFRFAEHDVFLPMMTLEELDSHKKGMSEVARNARQVSRSLDDLIAAADGVSLQSGLALDAIGNRDAKGRIFFQTQAVASLLPSSLPVGKADNQILGVVRALQEEQPGREVVLVSKDINMRIKAHALALRAEDYFNDQVLEDTDLLYSGLLQLPADFWDRHGKGVESWQQNGATLYRISGPLVGRLLINQFVYLEGDAPLSARVREISGNTAVLQTLRDHSHPRHAVWGIGARNREQNFALNLLLDPEIDFVTLLGQAGTGKTLLALASGLVQVLETRRYSEIIVTRATVPVGEDIGYLPGTEEEKMQPWMGALQDNLEVLMGADAAGGEWGRSASAELVRSKIRIKSLSFMRGRTFINKFLIIDEAQNLTPKQMKTLITRAGNGTKVVCLGNIAQIDTPYLTEGSSGLTYVVDRFKGWPHSGHVTLQRGERSRLADFAADAL